MFPRFLKLSQNLVRQVQNLFVSYFLRHLNSKTYKTDQKKDPRQTLEVECFISYKPAQDLCNEYTALSINLYNVCSML